MAALAAQLDEPSNPGRKRARSSAKARTCSGVASSGSKISRRSCSNEMAPPWKASLARLHRSYLA
jgi:hypothetical protein